MTMIPHSIEAEQSVIGAIFLDPDSWHHIAGMIQVGDFYRQDHKLIIEAIHTLARNMQPYDIVMVAEYLEQRGQLDKAGGLAYMVSIAENTASAANIMAYAHMVKTRAKLRALQGICKATLGLVTNPQDKSADEVIAETQTAIDNIVQSGGRNSLDWMDVLGEADIAIQEARQRAESGNPVGVPTGIPALDKRIGGLPKKRLIIVAGRPSLGKTAFVQQVVLHVASMGNAVGVCSLEMGADELGIRAYANTLEVNGTALQFGDKGVIDVYTNKLHNAPVIKYKIWVDDFTYSLSGIIARAHEWKHQHNISLFVVDHIGLIEFKASNTNERLGEITRTLKKLAKRLDIPVLAVCQLNRNVEKENRRPKLSDLRDSGNIEQDCDVALFLHSDDESEDGKINIEIGALKTRYGRKGWLPQRIEFDGRIQKFKEIYPHIA